ncbi:50S ribosomal protein L25 [Candidatus Parcubacteria bacterium]|nr:MAG: 50S ribosomal protein L25 [Candidatus Parcubacteria bacterium]
MTVTLTAEKREAGHNTDAVRRSGKIPAVVYGRSQESMPIMLDPKAFFKAFQAAGESTIVKLEGLGASHDVLIKAVQRDPVTGQPLHVDLYVIEKGQKVKVAVPLEFTGEAPAEKLGHIISKALHEIEIECAPADLPHSLAVDLSLLRDLGDHILAKDIKLPSSATLITHTDDIVASVTAVVEEQEPQPAAVAEGAAPVEGAAAQAPAEE